VNVPVYSVAGEVVRHIDISDDVFAVSVNQAVVHRALVRQLANARQGTASTQTRGQVTGSRQKLFRQKHTGRARAGSAKSPLRRGGGVVFGPHPRSYRQAMPRKMRRLAIRCVLSAKAGDNEMLILDEIKLDEPKTREMAKILAALEVKGSILIAASDPDVNLVKSASNLPEVKTIPARLLNVVDILSCRRLLITEAAVRQVERLWGREAS